MLDTLTFKGRLPGVVCEMALPPQAEDPLRLDVAGFVGIAERGPLNTPTMLEDIHQYAAIFGGDLVIALQTGAPVYANLPRAVSAFFDNGGRRCYVVRVAGDCARPNRFRIPGLMTWGKEQHAPIATASWVGRWSDGMSISTQLRSFPLKIGAVDVPFSYRVDSSGGQPALTAELHLELPTRDALKVGDLLLLTFGTALKPDYLLYFPIATLSSPADSSSTSTSTNTSTNSSAKSRIAVVAHSATAFVFEVVKDPPVGIPATIERLGECGWESVPKNRWVFIPESDQGIKASGSQKEEFSLILPRDKPIFVGDLYRISYGADTPQLLLSIIQVTQVEFEMPPDAGHPAVESYPRAIFQRPLRAIDTASAFVELGDKEPAQVDLLRFDLKISEGDQTLELWPELGFSDGADGWRQSLTVLADDSPPVTLEAMAGRSLRLRAPAAAGLLLPLNMSEIGSFATAIVDDNKKSKDGLDRFEPMQLFLDRQLDCVPFYTLRNELDNILYLLQPPGKLTKLHSLYAVDEIGLIAIPDLVHLGFAGPQKPTTTTSAETPKPEKERSFFDDCPPSAAPPKPALPQSAPCPQPSSSPPPILQVELPILADKQDYVADGMLAVQTALIHLCAAQADRMAILSLPHHFGRREALEWQMLISSRAASDDGKPLSYAAVYHPWLEIREDNGLQFAPLRALPPDGAVCGMIAAREIERGPWIAPANVSLRGVLRLDPPLTRQDWEALFNRQINLVRQTPGRFTLLSAHTLSSDRTLLQISVRRLLIYLRKLALRRGERYVFENNSPRFRQAIQMSFERTLNHLVQRGALVAFEVNTGREYNTENDEYNGRLIIVIKVAPTNPIEFITVVLLRTGDTLLDLLEP